jgi:hypothetical protein
MTKFKIKNSSLCFFIVYGFKFYNLYKKISLVSRAFNFAHFNYKLIYFYYISAFGVKNEEIKSLEKEEEREIIYSIAFQTHKKFILMSMVPWIEELIENDFFSLNILEKID